MGVNEPDLCVLSLADVGYLEDDKPASIVVGIESPLSAPSQQHSPLVLKLALSCYKQEVQYGLEIMLVFDKLLCDVWASCDQSCILTSILE